MVMNVAHYYRQIQILKHIIVFKRFVLVSIVIFLPFEKCLIGSYFHARGNMILLPDTAIWLYSLMPDTTFTHAAIDCSGLSQYSFQKVAS